MRKADGRPDIGWQSLPHAPDRRSASKYVQHPAATKMMKVIMGGGCPDKQMAATSPSQSAPTYAGQKRRKANRAVTQVGGRSAACVG